MGKYLKKFTSHTDYETYKNGQDFITPNVSYCGDANDVHYNPIEPPETSMICYYDIQNIGSTLIFNQYGQNVESIEIDGQNWTDYNMGPVNYTFNTTGQHIVKYSFYNQSTIGINNPMFQGISTLKSVVIPDIFTSISNSAFTQCQSLNTVTIGNGVTIIGNDAFNNCQYLSSVTFGDGITTIGEYAFNLCSSLTNVTLPDSLTTIGHDAFHSCSAITDVNIGNGIQTIGNSAFHSCSNLVNVTIGSSITELDGLTFFGCDNIMSITIKAITPPTIVTGTSNPAITSSKCTIYVPAQSVDTYKSASGWSDYASRIQAMPTT